MATGSNDIFDAPPVLTEHTLSCGNPYMQNAPLNLALAQSTRQHVVAVLLAVAVYDQVRYIVHKGSIAGPLFEVPLMGPFLQALDPNSKAIWRSGPGGP